MAFQLTLRFKGREFDPIEVCTKLSVGFLVTVSVRLSEQMIELSFQLLDAVGGLQELGLVIHAISAPII